MEFWSLNLLSVLLSSAPAFHNGIPGVISIRFKWRTRQNIKRAITFQTYFKYPSAIMNYSLIHSTFLLWLLLFSPPCKTIFLLSSSRSKRSKKLHDLCWAVGSWLRILAGRLINLIYFLLL